MKYSIGEFSKVIDLSIDTLRYYEKEGLIKPERNSTNQRVYSEADIAWMEFIKKLKLTGMPLKNIKRYSELRYQGNETVEERLDLLYEQSGALDQKKAEIEDHLSFLADKIEIYKEMLKNK
ncbi:MerR family transcriptional regulator [Enterococcus sp. JM4C]|uniref:MerR family transcriptional regulator n=1 Tax=Candidatus Enterococcus huntleyi TaxID=1857217 RepID=UPI001379A4D4|nr:MerR family transcriptional regulator [Enterococcus sp. JM4C]KAF1298444.1 MerR family transcriptional regulator [Enterococcus sp. JM4C]